MKRIKNITKDAKQDFLITLEDRTVLDMRLRYRPIPQIWVATFVYDNRQLDTVLVANNNLLAPWVNFINFGVSCYTDGIDPFKVSDFTPSVKRDARCRLFILNSTELETLQNTVYGV
jgi:hypothetical protein